MSRKPRRPPRPVGILVEITCQRCGAPHRYWARPGPRRKYCDECNVALYGPGADRQRRGVYRERRLRADSQAEILLARARLEGTIDVPYEVERITAHLASAGLMPVARLVEYPPLGKSLEVRLETRIHPEGAQAVQEMALCFRRLSRREFVTLEDEEAGRREEEYRAERG